MIDNKELNLHFFGQTLGVVNEIPLLSSPFGIEDSGLSIGFPEVDNSFGYKEPFGNTFSSGAKHGTRNVTIDLLVYDFDSTLVQDLYRGLSMLQYYQQYETYPMCALEVMYGVEVEGSTSKTYGGFLKVLEGSIEHDGSFYSVERAGNQAVLGQKIRINLVCDSYFYQNNPLYKSNYQQIVMQYYNGTDWTYSDVDGTTYINFNNVFRPMFMLPRLNSSGVNYLKGDVPSPIVLEITNSTGGNIDDIFIGTTQEYYTKSGYGPNTDLSDIYSGGLYPSYTPLLASTAYIDERMSGTVYLIGKHTGLADSIVANVSIRYLNITKVDSMDVFIPANLATTYFPIGTFKVPSSGRDFHSAYSVTMTNTATGLNFGEVIVVPARHFRGYLTGYPLGHNEKLIDNPEEDTLFTIGEDAAQVVAGITSHTGLSLSGTQRYRIGNGLFSMPNSRQFGACIALTTSGLYTSQFLLRASYNPRFISIRKSSEVVS